MSIVAHAILLTVLLTNVLSENTLTELINRHPVSSIAETTHPYMARNITERANYILELELYDREPNEIYDEDEWFDDYGLPYPEPPVKPNETDVPLQTKHGHLCFLRKSDKWVVAVYETKYELSKPVGMHDTGYAYTLVTLENMRASINVSAVYDMSELFPRILKLCWLDVNADYVYFNAAYNDFAEITGYETGYLYCFDISTGDIVWATKNLISSYYGFTVHEDYILTGYGFTDEEDFLYVIDRFTGEIVQTIPIRTAHEHIVVKGSLCFVRTYNTNYIFKITQVK